MQYGDHLSIHLLNEPVGELTPAVETFVDDESLPAHLVIELADELRLPRNTRIGDEDVSDFPTRGKVGG